MLKLSLHIMLMVVIVLTFGCKANQSGLSSAGVNKTGAQQQGQDGSVITIIPENPTVLVDLQVVSTLPDPSFSWEKNDAVIKGETTALLGRTQFVKGDRITAKAVSGGKSYLTSVTIGNTPPSVTAVSLTPEFIYHGVDTTAVPVGSDVDGDSIRYAYNWSVNGQEQSDHEAVLKGSAFKRGDRVILTVIPYDADGEGMPYISLPLVIPNAPPKFTSLPPTQFAGAQYSYQAHAEDADGDPMTYSLASGPSGMTINAATGELIWQIGKDGAGSHTIEIIAQDEPGLKAFQKYTLTVTIPDEEKK